MSQIKRKFLSVVTKDKSFQVNASFVSIILVKHVEVRFAELQQSNKSVYSKSTDEDNMYLFFVI